MLRFTPCLSQPFFQVASKSKVSDLDELITFLPFGVAFSAVHQSKSFLDAPQCLEGNPQCAAPPAFPSHSFDLLRARILDRSTLSSMSLMVSWPPALNSTRNPSSATMRAGHGGELIRNPGALFGGMPEPPICRHARSRIYMAYWFPDRSCLVSPVNTPHSKQTSTKSLHFALFPILDLKANIVLSISKQPRHFRFQGRGGGPWDPYM